MGEKKDEKESYSSIKDAFEGVPIKYEVKFVSDESYPDGANIEAGSVFTKTWKLLNSGNVAWPKETCLHFVGGTNLMPNFTKGVHVGEIQPNEEVCVSVTMKAPTKPGKYSSYFRMFIQLMIIFLLVIEYGVIFLYHLKMVFNILKNLKKYLKWDFLKILQELS